MAISKYSLDAEQPASKYSIDAGPSTPQASRYSLDAPVELAGAGIDPDVLKNATAALMPRPGTPTIRVAGQDIPVTDTGSAVTVDPLAPRGQETIQQAPPPPADIGTALFGAPGRPRPVPAPTRPLGAEETPFRTIGKGILHTGTEAVSGLTLGVADAAAKRVSGGKIDSLAGIVDHMTGFKPKKQDIAAGDIANFMTGISTAGKIAAPVIKRIAGKRALKVMAGSGLTFATRKAGEEFSDKVINNEPVDYGGISFEFGIGVMFGAGELGVEKLGRFVRGLRAAKTAKTHAQVTRQSARAEIDAAIKHWKKTGDRTRWDAVRVKYQGLDPKRVTPKKVKQPPLKDFGKHPLATRQPGTPPAPIPLAQQPPKQPTTDLTKLSRKQIQARAKAAGVPANQKSAAIIQQLQPQEQQLQLKGTPDATQITPPPVSPTAPAPITPQPIDTQQPGETVTALSREQANEIITDYQAWANDPSTKLTTKPFKDADKVDEAYHTVAVEFPTGIPDAQLFALPGNEKAMAKVASEMAKLKPLAKTKPGKPPAIATPSYPAPAKNLFSRLGKGKAKKASRYAVDGALVKGKDLVVTDGQRAYILKGDWGPDGLYDEPAAFKKGELKQRTLAKDETRGNFPDYKAIIPEVKAADGIELNTRKTWQQVRQAAVAAPSGKGEIPTIAIMKNPDGTIGFASAGHEAGIAAQIGVKDGAEQVVAVNSNFLKDALELHASRGETKIKMFLPEGDELRPILTRSPKGQTQTVTMPVNAVSTVLTPNVAQKTPVRVSAGSKPFPQQLAQMLVNADLLRTDDVASRSPLFILGNKLPARTWMTAEQWTGSKEASKENAEVLGRMVNAKIVDKNFMQDKTPVYAWAGTEPQADFQSDIEADARWPREKSPAYLGDESSPSTVVSQNEIDRGRIKVAMDAGGPVKPVPSRDIIAFAQRAFQIPIRGKATFRMAHALGWYHPFGKSIRLQDVRSITTATHEVGHHIDHIDGDRISKHPASTEIGKELFDMGVALYGNRKPVGGYKSEGWAEYMREYLTGGDTASIAPNMDKWFKDVFLPKHPDTNRNLNKLRQMISTWRHQGARGRISSMINRKPFRGTLGERMERASLWTEVNFIDELAPLKRRLITAGLFDLPPERNPYTLAVAYADKAPAVARKFILHSTTNLSGYTTGPGLTEIFKPIDHITEWVQYAVATRALDLIRRGKNPGISKADAEFVIKDTSDETAKIYDDVLDEVTSWNGRVLDYMGEAGAISEDTIKTIRTLNPVYIPFLRIFDWGEVKIASGSGKGFRTHSKPINVLSGSGREFMEPIEAMLTQAERLISIAHKTMVAQAIAKVVNQPGGHQFGEKVPTPRTATNFSVEQIKGDVLKIIEDKLGIDLGDLPDVDPEALKERWDEMLTVYSNAAQYWGKDNIIPIINAEGKREFIQLDKDVFQTVMALDQYSLPPWLNATVGGATRLRRLGATGLNPGFGLIRNFVRDASTFGVTAEHAKGGAISAARGVVSDIRGTEAARHFKALGGEMSGQLMHDRVAAKNLRAEMLLDRTKMGKYVIKTVAHPIQAARELFSVTESGVRIAEFEAALKVGEEKFGKGTLNASLFALNAAQDVTTNFTRHGKIAKVLNQVFPFYNANIQGPQKIFRTFADPKTRGRAAAMAIGTLTIPALGLWYAYRDEDWWKNMADFERVNYMHFRAPGTDTVVRLPVPFQVGHVFASLPVAAVDAAYRKDPTSLPDDLVEMLDQSNPFGSRNIITGMALAGPVVDVMRNKDWAGRPIVPPGTMHLLDEDQYGRYTTDTMKAIGRALNMSPSRTEYLIDSYSGGLFRRFARGWGMISGSQQGSRNYSDIPVFGTLFMREPNSPRDQLTKFYKARDTLNRKFASKKITPKERAMRTRFNKVATQLQTDYEALEKTTNDPQRKRIYQRIRRRLP